MRKIISLFQRNYDGDRLVRDEVVPGAEWVLDGEGRATQKFDGTCCMIRGDQLFARYEVKKGKTPPADFEAATDVDDETGKQQGWVPVGEGPEWRWHREAFAVVQAARASGAAPGFFKDGTYELVGPKVQGNPERFEEHGLVPHGALELKDAPRDFGGLRDYFSHYDIEGIVWHHPDGRMVKIKKKDFGFKRDGR